MKVVLPQFLSSTISEPTSLEYPELLDICETMTPSKLKDPMNRSQVFVDHQDNFLHRYFYLK